MSYETAKDLLEAISKYNKATDGPSGDAELEAGIDMRDCALAFLRSQGGLSVDMADLIDSYDREDQDEVENDGQ